MTTCREIPAQPAIPAIPGHFAPQADYGWNTGANSVDEVDGDLQVTFDMRAVTGVVIGLFPAVDRGSWEASYRERLTHALYFHRHGALAPRVSVMEGGVVITTPVAYSPGDTFALRRIGSTVDYLHNGQRLYTSRTPSADAQIVGACLYASEDIAPGTADCFWTDLLGPVTQDCDGGAPGGMDLFALNWRVNGDGLTGFVAEGFVYGTDAVLTIPGQSPADWPMTYNSGADAYFFSSSLACNLNFVPATLTQGGNSWPVTFSTSCF